MESKENIQSMKEGGEALEQSVFKTGSSLIDQVKHASSGSGVYLMKDMQNCILYIGKALNLKKRLQSYFQSGRPLDPKTRVMLNKVARIETIQTHTEKEALILESNLIKRHRPRYNVVLKDDKRYPSLRLDMSRPYPELLIVRKIQNDGALYFGPYASAQAVRETLRFIHKTFKLRKCRHDHYKNRTRPCLNFQMGLCLGACNGVDPQLYNSVAREVIAFLRGRTPALIRKVKRNMQEAAEQLDFERAAQLRDKMVALQKTLERQVSVSTDFKDRDVIALVSQGDRQVATLLRVRGGFLLGSRHFGFEGALGSTDEQMGLFLRQYYDSAHTVPPEIMVNEMPADAVLIEEFLGERRAGNVQIVSPRRGEKHRLVQLALQNAQSELVERIQGGSRRQHLLERLQFHLRLNRLPQRIECFDNSNLSGSGPVSAMAVLEQGQPRTDLYRRYKIQALGKPDDYAFMAEVLRRRFRLGHATELLPDLLLVDGGKGQINVALTVLAEMGLRGRLDVAGIAKGEDQDKVYIPGRANPIQFGRDGEALLLLQRLRDEAHRWAVGFQRRRRNKAALHSVLDEIPGIGPKRRIKLLTRFGNVTSIRQASIAELREVAGISAELAEAIRRHLVQSGSGPHADQ
jgi:excinuclease ABC subunit C